MLTSQCFCFSSMKALLKLKGRNGRCANESRSVRAACLPTDLFPEGTRCTISGYGATEKRIPTPLFLLYTFTCFLLLLTVLLFIDHGVSTQLLDAKVLLISQSRCMSRNVYGNRMDDSMMCAGYMQGKIDSCQVLTYCNFL